MLKSLRVLAATSFVLGAASLEAANAAAIPLANADFQQGPVGFTTDYRYDLIWLDAGEYYIDTADLFGWSAGVGDHTTGSGKFAMYNAASTPGLSLWGQNVTLQAGVSYAFSGWVNLLNPGAPLIDLLVGGAIVGHATFANTTDVWQQFTIQFSSTVDGLVNLSLVNNNLLPSGVDFGLDDLELASIEEISVHETELLVTPLPGALPLFISALAAAGVARRRKKRAAA